MRWYRALTYKREQTGTDETRNPVFRLVETGEHILVRASSVVSISALKSGEGLSSGKS